MAFIEAWVAAGSSPSERVIRIFVDGTDASGIRTVRLFRSDNSLIRTFAAAGGDFAHCALSADLVTGAIDQTAFPITIAAEYCDETPASVVVEATIPVDDVASPRSPGGCRPGTRPTTLCREALSAVATSRRALEVHCDRLRRARERLTEDRNWYIAAVAIFLAAFVAMTVAAFIPFAGWGVVGFLAWVAFVAAVMVTAAIERVWHALGELTAAERAYTSALAAHTMNIQRVVSLCCPQHYQPADIACPACL